MYYFKCWELMRLWEGWKVKTGGFLWGTGNLPVPFEYKIKEGVYRFISMYLCTNLGL